MKVKITLPTDLRDVPLKEYQEFDRISKQYKDKDADEYITLNMVSIFGNVGISTLKKMELSNYDIAVNHINQLFEQQPTFRHTITIAGQKFGFIPNMEEMSIGEYIDIENYLKDTQDWHKFMAVCYRPITVNVQDTYEVEEYDGSDKYADLMKHASFGDTYAVVLFFWSLAKDLLDVTLNSLELESKTMIEESVQDSDESGDGIKASTILQARTYLDSMLSQNFPFTPFSQN